MQTRTKGIQVNENGERVVEKQYRKQRIFCRLGVVSQDSAEAYLREECNRIDNELSQGIQRNFYVAAQKYLEDCQRRGVRTIDVIAYHITLVLPYIGMMPLEAVHSGSLESFCDSRLEEDGVKAITVNRSLEVVRTILNKSARVWRGDDGKALLASPPLIEMLAENRRPPYPITWDEQNRLFDALPSHLRRMAQFAVNTGLRDDNVCGLRWQWERRIPKLGRSVFIIPAAEFKGKRPHVAILNDVAMSIVESVRGVHSEFVFAYHHEKQKLPPGRVDTINNTAWQNARKRVNLSQVRVHDLRHTFGQRLRSAGVANEDRKVLMGHATEDDMGEHYATPTIERLVEMANLVSTTRDETTLLRVVNS